MYENASTTRTGTNLGVACTPQTEQLLHKCGNVMGMSQEINSISNIIKAKLFGNEPGTGKVPEKTPGSLEDMLLIAKATLDSAINTLRDINNRL